MPDRWSRVVEVVDFALQPIVNIHTGATHGVECLLRHHERAGFDSIPGLFDAAWGDGVLRPLSQKLREKAIGAVAATGLGHRLRAFLNLDNRELVDGWPGDELVAACERLRLSPAAVCFEISERHPLPSAALPLDIRSPGDRGSYKVAIDDFGTGFSGLQLLYASRPDFIKIDRFFIADIGADPRKRLFVTSIVSIAHLLGIVVIAEGVESLDEYYICRSVGCDLVQGYFVQRPVLEATRILETYGHVEEACRSDRRHTSADESLIMAHLQQLQAIPVDSEMSAVLERFARAKDASFFPVVNELGEPIGIVKESALRGYAYSVYGRDLIRNPSLRGMLRTLVDRCPIADVNMSAERILELFSLDPSSDGLLLASGLRYAGFLSASSLLQIVHEKNLVAARDQNPLTRLPGNRVIYSFASEALLSGARSFTLVYFDFDDFKPFNDSYGFRAGDRAIQLFAELLQSHWLREHSLVGHIGGDDFFVGIRDVELALTRDRVLRVMQKFGDDVASLYTPEDRRRGWVESRARNGDLRRYPLLRVSAAVLHLPPGPPRGSIDGVIGLISTMKKEAKASSSGLATAVLDVGGDLVPTPRPP